MFKSSHNEINRVNRAYHYNEIVQIIKYDIQIKKINSTTTTTTTTTTYLLHGAESFLRS